MDSRRRLKFCALTVARKSQIVVFVLFRLEIEQIGLVFIGRSSQPMLGLDTGLL